ncbi:glycosyl hydrolase [Actinoallomurus vinaceus]|uniref:Glycosyl hydrolase n=1 Tax=Actinoallomurus vinaceus TaxID=1080074 RepID=A0ABP8U5D4_9ACTN
MSLNSPPLRRRGVGRMLAIGAVAVGMSVSSAAGAVTAAPPSAIAIVPDRAPTLTAGTFQNPPANVRPKYRWWVPLAHTDDDELRAEVQQIAASGAGGVEVAPFGVPGAGNQQPEFLRTYGWGTRLWTRKLQVIIAEANKYGLTVDQNMGPHYPPTVPTVTDVNDPAAAQQLAYGTAFVRGGTAFRGALPTPTSGVPAGAKTTLVAVAAVKCVEDSCPMPEGGSRQLDRSTVTDLTKDAKDGTLDWTAPKGTWALLAFYQTADGLTKTGLSATTPNYVVDHLSSAGANAVASFWDSAIFTPETRRLLSRMNGTGSIFEDSLEMGADQLWTWDFASQFTKRRGYSIIEALPALTGVGQQGAARPAFDFSDGSGARFRQDYRQTWSDLYIDRYVTGLQRWARSHSVNYRAQAYGDPIQTGRAARVTGVPEGESLDFGSPNAYGAEQDYKVLAGGAHSVGTTRISTECCAVFNGAYRSTVSGRDLNQDLTTDQPWVNGDAQNGNLDSAYKAFAGGVTQVVWHGFAYKDAPAGLASPNPGEGGTWPGYNPWNIRGYLNVGELFGPRAPQWRDYRTVNDHLSRLQLVLRQGRPRLDLAVYYQDLGLAGQSVGSHEAPAHMLGVDSATAAAGYTYEYLTPDTLAGAPNKDRRLLPDGAAYKGLVLNDQTTITLDAAERILTLARQGLPVFVIGDTPSAVPGAGTASQDARVKALITQLLHQPGVRHLADEAGLPAALDDAGLGPDAKAASSAGALETVHRNAGDADYYFIYNRSGSRADTTISLAGSGRPYRLDSWTGTIDPIAAYTKERGSIRVPVKSAPYDVTVIAVTGKGYGAKPNARYAVDTNADVRYGGDGSLLARATGDGDYTAVLDIGRRVSTVIKDVPPPQKPTSWRLSAESWTPGATQGQTRKTTLPTTEVVAKHDGTLPSWSEITTSPDLGNASGVGTYTTTVVMPAGWNKDNGAYLDLGKAVDTVRVEVNGRLVSGIDQSDINRIDLGKQLHAGSNTITVTVSTTLYNAVKATGGATYRLPNQRTGLLGPVVLTPYAESPLR